MFYGVMLMFEIPQFFRVVRAMLILLLIDNTVLKEIFTFNLI